MSKKKLFVSESEIIGIREFMSEYLNVEYTEEGRLTHYEMERFLLEKGKNIPQRISFKTINPIDITNGTYLVVREEAKKMKKGKKLVYENPQVFNANDLLNELISNSNKDKLRKIRKQILNEEFDLDLTPCDEVIPMEEAIEEQKMSEFTITDSVNRQKTYVMTSKNRLRRKA